MHILPCHSERSEESYVCHFQSKKPPVLWTDPGRKDKEKKTLSQNSSELRGLAPDFKRSEAVF